MITSKIITDLQLVVLVSHITLVFKDLHWLVLHFYVKFKLFILI